MTQSRARVCVCVCVCVVAEEAKKVFFQKLAYGKSFAETFRKVSEGVTGTGRNREDGVK